MDRIFLAVAGWLGALAVVAGAFGAHALRARLSPEMLVAFSTAVWYHLAHTLALLGVAWAANRWPGWASTLAGWLFVAGVVLFSGSLYLLSLTGIRGFGYITPVGGLAFIAGWLTLAWVASPGR
jgi:uncharacterized membrane protein YgdD (TMEM256/DUF423 family)